MVGQNRGEGYSPTSIALHWLTAVAVVALFLTHEGERGSAARMFHVGGGAGLGVLLLWRVWYRLRHGWTRKPAQPTALNWLSSLVRWGLLAAIVVVVMTGYLLPWSVGQPLDILGPIAIPSPIDRVPWLHEAVEELHEVSGQAFVPLLLLHVLGAAKHAFIDRDGVAARIFRPLAGGR